MNNHKTPNFVAPLNIIKHYELFKQAIEAGNFFVAKKHLKAMRSYQGGEKLASELESEVKQIEKVPQSIYPEIEKKDAEEEKAKKILNHLNNFESFLKDNYFELAKGEAEEIKKLKEEGTYQKLLKKLERIKEDHSPKKTKTEESKKHFISLQIFAEVNEKIEAGKIEAAKKMFNKNSESLEEEDYSLLLNKIKITEEKEAQKRKEEIQELSEAFYAELSQERPIKAQKILKKLEKIGAETSQLKNDFTKFENRRKERIKHERDQKSIKLIESFISEKEFQKAKEELEKVSNTELKKDLEKEIILAEKRSFIQSKNNLEKEIIALVHQNEWQKAEEKLKTANNFFKTEEIKKLTSYLSFYKNYFQNNFFKEKQKHFKEVNSLKLLREIKNLKEKSEITKTLKKTQKEEENYLAFIPTFLKKLEQQIKSELKNSEKESELQTFLVKYLFQLEQRKEKNCSLLVKENQFLSDEEKSFFKRALLEKKEIKVFEELIESKKFIEAEEFIKNSQLEKFTKAKLNLSSAKQELKVAEEKNNQKISSIEKAIKQLTQENDFQTILHKEKEILLIKQNLEFLKKKKEILEKILQKEEKAAQEDLRSSYFLQKQKLEQICLIKSKKSLCYLSEKEINFINEASYQDLNIFISKVPKNYNFYELKEKLVKKLLLSLNKTNEEKEVHTLELEKNLEKLLKTNELKKAQELLFSFKEKTEVDFYEKEEKKLIKKCQANFIKGIQEKDLEKIKELLIISKKISKELENEFSFLLEKHLPNAIPQLNKLMKEKIVSKEKTKAESLRLFNEFVAAFEEGKFLKSNIDTLRKKQTEEKLADFLEERDFYYQKASDFSVHLERLINKKDPEQTSRIKKYFYSLPPLLIDKLARRKLLEIKEKKVILAKNYSEENLASFQKIQAQQVTKQEEFIKKLNFELISKKTLQKILESHLANKKKQEAEKQEAARQKIKEKLSKKDFKGAEEECLKLKVKEIYKSIQTIKTAEKEAKGEAFKKEIEKIFSSYLRDRKNTELKKLEKIEIPKESYLESLKEFLFLLKDSMKKADETLTKEAEELNASEKYSKAQEKYALKHETLNLLKAIFQTREEELSNFEKITSKLKKENYLFSKEEQKKLEKLEKIIAKNQFEAILIHVSSIELEAYFKEEINLNFFFKKNIYTKLIKKLESQLKVEKSASEEVDTRVLDFTKECSENNWQKAKELNFNLLFKSPKFIDNLEYLKKLENTFKEQNYKILIQNLLEDIQKGQSLKELRKNVNKLEAICFKIIVNEEDHEKYFSLEEIYKEIALFKPFAEQKRLEELKFKGDFDAALLELEKLEKNRLYFILREKLKKAFEKNNKDALARLKKELELKIKNKETSQFWEIIKTNNIPFKIKDFDHLVRDLLQNNN
jgi:hypothetical protein